MPHFNQITLVGHATRDPETKTFPSGGSVVNFGIAVNSRKKNQQTGQWEDKPTFIDCKAFGSEKSKLAGIIGDYVRKGSAILISGKLDQETWTDKATGGNRSKHVILVDEMQLLSPKSEKHDSIPDNHPDPEPEQGNIPF